jgi:hypothetical protein
LTCGKAIHLINDLIDNTEHQQRLVKWKVAHGINQTPEEMKTVGNAYWYAFLRRHAQRIRTKKVASLSLIALIGPNINIFRTCTKM